MMVDDDYEYTPEPHYLEGLDLLDSLAGRVVKIVKGAGLLGVIDTETEELYVLREDQCDGCSGSRCG